MRLAVAGAVWGMACSCSLGTVYAAGGFEGSADIQRIDAHWVHEPAHCPSPILRPREDSPSRSEPGRGLG